MSFDEWFEEHNGKLEDENEYYEQEHLVIRLSIQLEEAERKLQKMKNYKKARSDALYGWNAAIRYYDDK